MKRPRQHVMEKESRQLLESLLPSEWIVRDVADDYGVDLEIELVDQTVVSGDRIWVQLKSEERSTRRAHRFPIGHRFPAASQDAGGNITADYIAYSLSTKEIEYARRCHFPLILVVVDLAVSDAYWVPLRNEAEIRFSGKDTLKPGQKSATLQIPVWSSLRDARQDNFEGFRWYALEPGRMYAFAKLAAFYNEFRHSGRLTGYSIGDGWIDNGEESELMIGLELAIKLLHEALDLDVLFGSKGLDYFLVDQIPGFGFPGIKRQLVTGLAAASLALEKLKSGNYTFKELSLLTFKADHAINLMLSSIWSYDGFRGKFLVTEQTAVWRAMVAVEKLPSAWPIIPVSEWHGDKDPKSPSEL